MIVVSDTSPLNYLVLVGAIDVLPKLFREVIVPPEVMRELPAFAYSRSRSALSKLKRFADAVG